MANQLTHQESAKSYLSSAEKSHYQPGESQHYSNLAIAHAVLALIDFISSDREDEIELISGDREDEIAELQAVIDSLEESRASSRKTIADLEFQLEGCRNALRQREDAMAASMKQQQEKT